MGNGVPEAARGHWIAADALVKRIGKLQARLDRAVAVCEAYLHSADSPVGSVARDNAILELDKRVKAYLAGKKQETDDGEKESNKEED